MVEDGTSIEKSFEYFSFNRNFDVKALSAIARLGDSSKIEEEVKDDGLGKKKERERER